MKKVLMLLGMLSALSLATEVCVIDSFKVNERYYPYEIMCINGYQYLYRHGKVGPQMFETYEAQFKEYKASVPISCNCWVGDKK